jgi:hypothetical protein
MSDPLGQPRRFERCKLVTMRHLRDHGLRLEGIVSKSRVTLVWKNHRSSGQPWAEIEAVDGQKSYSWRIGCSAAEGTKADVWLCPFHSQRYFMIRVNGAVEAGCFLANFNSEDFWSLDRES